MNPLPARWILLSLLLAAGCKDDSPSVIGGRKPDPKNEPAPAFLELPERPVPGRVFVVAIDGASWEVFDDVLADGIMPRLAELTRRGSKTELTSMDPTASAILWTTIATGKLPKKHGILGFVSTTPEGRVVPVSSTMRKVKALWNIASEAGVSVGFLAWWVSWPAEPVRGFLATDYAWPLKKDRQGFATGSDVSIERERRTYPEELIRELDPFILTEARVAPAELARLGVAAVPRMQGYAVRDILLKDISIGQMTRHMLERKNGESLIATYFDGYDAFCHVFWPAYKQYSAARGLGPEAIQALEPMVRALGQALDLHLARIDADLGFIMDQAGPDDTVLVISDHGFFDNPGGQPIERTYGDFIENQPFWHTRRGILAAMGGPIRKGASGVEASILDITPTILALLGLEVAEDMDGQVLTGLLTEQFLKDHPVDKIETYETGERATSATESPYDEAMLERLRELGYLGK